jgi:hypothetical protein
MQSYLLRKIQGKVRKEIICHLQHGAIMSRVVKKAVSNRLKKLMNFIKTARLFFSCEIINVRGKDLKNGRLINSIGTALCFALNALNQLSRASGIVIS